MNIIIFTSRRYWPFHRCVQSYAVYGRDVPYASKLTSPTIRLGGEAVRNAVRAWTTP